MASATARQHKQFSAMSLMFRPAGIPHQDEIAPGGLRFFHVELRPGWKARLAECSGKLDQGCEDARGGPLFWLAMQLFRETFAVELADPPLRGKPARGSDGPCGAASSSGEETRSAVARARLG